MKAIPNSRLEKYIKSFDLSLEEEQVCSPSLVYQVEEVLNENGIVEKKGKLVDILANDARDYVRASDFSLENQLRAGVQLQECSPLSRTTMENVDSAEKSLLQLQTIKNNIEINTTENE